MSTLVELIADYRHADAVGDNAALDLAAPDIKHANENIYWALLDETVALREIARLDGIGMPHREYDTMIANAHRIIADELAGVSE